MAPRIFAAITRGLTPRRGKATADLSGGLSEGRVYGGGFEAARLGRRLRGWVAERRTINALLQAGGDQLRARARQLCRENPYAANACEAYAAAAVGAGVVPSSLMTDPDLKDAVQRAWNTWIEEADADGVTDFYGLQALAARAQFEAGECFIRFRPRRLTDGLSVPLQVQLLESEMLPFSKNEAATGGVIREGIEFDAIGRRVAYHFYTSHPGETYPLIFDFQTTRVPASEVLHLYKPLRPGQIRGQPQCTPSMVRLYLLDLYDDAELDRKRVAAMFAGFVTKKSPENETPIGTVPGGDLSNYNGGSPLDSATELAPLEPGQIQVLMEGEDIKFSSPAEVGGSYEAFVWRNLTAIASGLGVPYSDVTSDTSKANYSSERADQVRYRRRIDQFQHLVLVHQMCKPIWKRWFEIAVLAGALPISTRELASDPRGLVAAKWIPPKWDWVDPWKDRKAEEIAVNNGWKSRYDVIEAEGEDPVDTDRRILLAQKSERDLELKFRPVTEKLNVNVGAEAATPDEAVEAADDRGGYA